MPQDLRVVVADDHPAFRAGIVAILEDLEDLEVVAAVADGHHALTAVAEHAPDVVLMDLRMPNLDGVAATAQLRSTHPSVAVVVLTMNGDDDSLFAALRAGARGYLLKEADGDEIARAIRAVARGEAVFGPAVAPKVLEFFARPPSAGGAVAFPQLTDREREVLDLVARGLDNASVARRLVLSEKTIRNRVSDVLSKLHASSRAEVVALARDAGLGGTG